MERLGYERYGAQGGDWGAAVSREMGRTRPEVIGVHLNLMPNSCATRAEARPTSGAGPGRAGAHPRSWERFKEWTRERQGYADIQSTRPQTLAYGLTDSPVGQLAWIVEKFQEWTTGLPGAVDRDLLLTNVMLYWLTGTAGSSARIYYERAHADDWGAPPEPSTAPTALAPSPGRTSSCCGTSPRRTNNIVRWTEYDRGGHFAGDGAAATCWSATSGRSSGRCDPVAVTRAALRSAPGHGRLAPRVPYPGCGLSAGPCPASWPGPGVPKDTSPFRRGRVGAHARRMAERAFHRASSQARVTGTPVTGAVMSSPSSPSGPSVTAARRREAGRGRPPVGGGPASAPARRPGAGAGRSGRRRRGPRRGCLLPGGS